MILRGVAKSIRLSLLITLVALLASPPLQAVMTNSPEALAMQLVNAWRGGDADAIAQMYYSTDAVQINQVRQEWRNSLRRYQMSGYRVVNLSGAERQQLQQLFREGRLSLEPLNKLVLELNDRRNKEQLSFTLYIGASTGGYFFITSSGR